MRLSCARGAIGCALVMALVAVLAPAAAAQQPVPTGPVVIDGPSSAIVSPSGLAVSVSRDGTGGVAYLKHGAGGPRVFVSAFTGGSFHAPQQLDAALPGSSSAPVIAAGNGGLLLVAFVSGGELYVVEKASASAGFGPLQGLVSGASSPAISITNFGKAYLAFTVPDGSGTDVRAAYFYKGAWALEAAPLNATPADDAGTGTGRPEVAAAGDGVAIVVWGEHSSIISRRLWGTAPSVLDEQADGPLPGCTEISADDPVVGTEGDSSYADVAFQEQLTCGTHQSRVLMNRLRGSAYDGLTQPDGLTPGSADGATDPQIAMGEYGRGLVVSQRTSTHNLFATALGNDGASVRTTQVNSMTQANPAYAVPSTAGLSADLVAWQQDPGGTGVPEIRVRYAPNGSTLGPEMVVSSPAAGPTEAATGLAAAGDVSGDSVIAWAQGTGAATEITAARLYQPPGGFRGLATFQYQRTAQPVLGWTAAQEAWGPLTYTLSVDGNAVGQTSGTSLQVPRPLPDGPHLWQATATNPADQTSTMRAATVFIDTVMPVLSVTTRAKARVDSSVTLHLSYSDSPQPGEPASDASGVARVIVRWGDRATATIRLGSRVARHVYRRPGRYSITVLATDAAGNTTSELTHVEVGAPKRKPVRGRTPRGKGRG